jgi:hypothetical protein
MLQFLEKNRLVLEQGVLVPQQIVLEFLGCAGVGDI